MAEYTFKNYLHDNDLIEEYGILHNRYKYYNHLLTDKKIIIVAPELSAERDQAKKQIEKYHFWYQMECAIRDVEPETLQI